MYACAFLERAGQNFRTSVICQLSENQINWVEVLIQPPIPTVSPSAMASASAMQCRTGDCRMVRSWSCVKQAASQRSACLLSLRRCSSVRDGSDSLTHWGLCDGGTTGTSCLLRILTEPTSSNCDFAEIQRPAGGTVTSASGERLSRNRCQSLA